MCCETAFSSLTQTLKNIASHQTLVVHVSLKCLGYMDDSYC